MEVVDRVRVVAVLVLQTNPEIMEEARFSRDGVRFNVSALEGAEEANSRKTRGSAYTTVGVGVLACLACGLSNPHP